VTSLVLGGNFLNYVDQEIVVETETPFGAEVPLPISSSLFRHLNDTARPCVRMAIEGSSASVGAVPGWLERASDIRTLGFEKRDGYSVLHLKAPKLGDAAPDLFQQHRLWPGLAGPDDTVIQLIGKVGEVVRRREESSDIYDKPLLRHFTHWRTLFRREVKEVQFPDASGTGEASVLNPTVVANAQQLSAQTPSPRQLRVVGKLDMVRHSTRSFGLVLNGGEEVRGVLLEGDPSLLQQYFGREITVFGKAVYRPSGSLLRIDAQEFLGTSEGREFFSSIPQAMSAPARTDRKPQPVKRGGAAFFGTWPGEESDEELLAALGELRR
jgi:hypothetical protein